MKKLKNQLIKTQKELIESFKEWSSVIMNGDTDAAYEIIKKIGVIEAEVSLLERQIREFPYEAYNRNRPFRDHITSEEWMGEDIHYLK